MQQERSLSAVIAIVWYYAPYNATARKSRVEMMSVILLQPVAISTERSTDRPCALDMFNTVMTFSHESNTCHGAMRLLVFPTLAFIDPVTYCFVCHPPQTLHRNRFSYDTPSRIGRITSRYASPRHARELSSIFDGFTHILVETFNQDHHSFVAACYTHFPQQFVRERKKKLKLGLKVEKELKKNPEQNGHIWIGFFVTPSPTSPRYATITFTKKWFTVLEEVGTSKVNFNVRL